LSLLHCVVFFHGVIGAFRFLVLLSQAHTARLKARQRLDNARLMMDASISKGKLKGGGRGGAAAGNHISAELLDTASTVYSEVQESHGVGITPTGDTSVGVLLPSSRKEGSDEGEAAYAPASSLPPSHRGSRSPASPGVGEASLAASPGVREAPFAASPFSASSGAFQDENQDGRMPSSETQLLEMVQAERDASVAEKAVLEARVNELATELAQARQAERGAQMAVGSRQQAVAAAESRAAVAVQSLHGV
jgi:hypothetical protein